MMKFTKKMALELAINAIENSTLPNWSYTKGEDTLEISKADAIEKIQQMIVQLDAKASAPKKPTAKQTENETFKAIILEALEGSVPMTISEMQAKDERLAPTVISNQRVASLVRIMVNDGVLIRTEEKRKAYFSIANK